jgi:hypothetical protein
MKAFRLLPWCALLLFLGSPATVWPDQRPISAKDGKAPAEEIKGAADQMIAVLRSINALASEKNAYEKHKVELSALFQLQETLINKTNKAFAHWSNEDRQMYRKLLGDGIGDAAQSLGIFTDVPSSAAQGKRSRAKAATPSCICPWCGTFCSCPLLCGVITDPPNTCNNFYQWVLGPGGFQAHMCVPSGGVFFKCAVSRFELCD